MKKIIISLSVIAAVAAVAIGATTAFFSDTETSTGNMFTAGAIDLKIDSESHYNGLICRDIGPSAPDYRWRGVIDGSPTTEELSQEHYNDPCDGTWAETDLGLTHKFFKLTDVKPGDVGENTISLHLTNNDGWGRFVISAVKDYDNTCTEPEDEVVTEGCTVATPENQVPGSGELSQNISFFAWLDQGTIPGFQCNNPNNQTPPAGARCTADPHEGDNIQQCNNPQSIPSDCAEPTVITPGPVDDLNNNDNSTEIDETHNIWEALDPIFNLYCTTEPVNGHNNYDSCHGLADDGRMVGSVTYYFGLWWTIPTTVGNEAQTDSLTADLSFQAVQHRNNPRPTPTF
ncbi:hypothetical protein A2Z53_03240 [Candidatus Giovannonibacteria bacterium RIFCSPHIGHO2_02_42_15]|uniref:SipW-cognate class signal peptide n=2 Tax=Candidatus Giovannoniibacteriota TaxID=1752738 RepID=A0A1F5VPA1_9BACT|nr:MAG: hypothetical protein UV11_C0031G0009 [Candidatus Giovannonibacteria bacterium GW2011_GWF2_42_19]OGF65264.1 MAG: hypothetical protein A2Z53_03240 [Candidatus Giovannonibacteria bacterium RIFCSPHIGHO2_02_42_15]